LLAAAAASTSSPMPAKRHPTEEEFGMLDAMSSKDPEAWNNWVRAQGFEPDPDLPVCLSAIPPEQWVCDCKVLPTPGIQRYLESGDPITEHTTNMMELSLERDYNVQRPWYITSVSRRHFPEKTVTLEYFYLTREDFCLDTEMARARAMELGEELPLRKGDIQD
jgi:hypothetical protein